MSMTLDWVDVSVKTIVRGHGLRVHRTTGWIPRFRPACACGWSAGEVTDSREGAVAAHVEHKRRVVAAR